MKYQALTVDGNYIPVKIEGQYPRATPAGFETVLIGKVMMERDGLTVPKIIFFDIWGDVFWVGNILDDYIEDVIPDRSVPLDIGWHGGSWVTT